MQPQRKGVLGSRRAESAAVAAVADRLSHHKPVIVTGISPGEFITVTPSMFSRLDVDASYQRGETGMVNSIIRTLQSGGKVLDPVTLCERRGDKDDKLWIVDGHQRVCAFQHMKMPFTAMLHKSDDVDSEKTFFVALNAKRSLNANVIVKAWTGPVGEMIRRANENPEHPLYNRINLTQSSNDAKIAASSLVRSLNALTGTNRSSQISVMLSTVDLAIITRKLDRARVEHYLRLLGYVSPSGSMPHLVLRALATVARERWKNDAVIPNKKVIERLRTKQWATACILVEKYFSILLDVVRKAWPVVS
jgi:hypothetical protein